MEILEVKMMGLMGVVARLRILQMGSWKVQYSQSSTPARYPFLRRHRRRLLLGTDVRMGGSGLTING